MTPSFHGPRPRSACRTRLPLDRVHAMRTAGRSARFGSVVADRDVDAVVISEPWTRSRNEPRTGCCFYPGRDRPAAVVVRVTPSHPAMVAGAQAACIPRSEVPASARVGSVSRRGFSLLVVSLILAGCGAQAQEDTATTPGTGPSETLAAPVGDLFAGGLVLLDEDVVGPPYYPEALSPAGGPRPSDSELLSEARRSRPPATRRCRTQPHAASRIRPSRSASPIRRCARRSSHSSERSPHPPSTGTRPARASPAWSSGPSGTAPSRNRSRRPAAASASSSTRASKRTPRPALGRSRTRGISPDGRLRPRGARRGRRAGLVHMQQLLADPTIADERTELAQSTNAWVVIRLNTHEAVLRSSPRAFRRCAERAPRGLERPYFAAFFDPLADPDTRQSLCKKRPPRLGSRQPARPPRSTSTSKQSCSSTRIRARLRGRARPGRRASRPRCRPGPRDARPSPSNPRRTGLMRVPRRPQYVRR